MTDLYVRTATPMDAGALFDLQVAPPVTTVREHAELIRTTLKHYPFLIAECDGRVLGSAYAGAHRCLAAFRWSVDVCVDVPCRSPAVVQALYGCLISHLREQGFMAIYAAVSINDADSAALHEALGFTAIGVRQCDDLECEADYWCMTLSATPAREEPVAFNQLPQGVCGL